MKFTRNQKGFSLVELMIVVAIIGVLAALAVPKFSQFQAKARQAEAKNNLNHIYTLETAYQGDNDKYTATLTDIGFVVKGTTRYTYTVAAPTDATFTATATSGTSATNKVFPGCATADVWTINQDKVLADTGLAISKCAL